MANARRKPDEEPGIRSVTGFRMARERMLLTVVPQEALGLREAPCIVMPMRSSGSSPDLDFTPDWPKAAKPEPDLRFSRSAQDATDSKYPSRTVMLSVLAHASLLAIALFAFPRAAEFPQGGETAIPVDMVIVAPDSTDAAATESGAKPETVEVSIPLPEQVTEAVVIALPEVVVLPPDAAPPVRIEIPEPPAPVVQQAEPLPPAPVAPDGILPPKIAPAELPVPPKPRPVVDQDRIRRDALAAREVRRQEQLQEKREEQREEQRQAQIAERRKQQAQRAVVDAQRRASAESAQPAPSPQRTAVQGRGEAGAGTEQKTRQARQAGGSAQGPGASAGTAEIASYRSRILAHLARYKTYPESAQDAGVQGRATVSFTITRSGGVASASLAGSSGAGVLDQATLAMVRRAQPFPAMPSGGPASMSFTAVIRYDLR